MTVTNAKNKSFIERHIALVFVIVFALIGGIVMLVTTSAASGQGAIVSKVTANKCLDNSNNRKVHGNKIQLQNCNNTSAQNWTVTSRGAIVNANGYCLAVADESQTVEIAVQLHVCRDTPAQKWTLNGDGSILNPHSGLCLEDRYGSIENGNQIWVQVCNNTKAQKWTTPPIINNQ